MSEKKRGRPLKEDAKRGQYRIRLSEEEENLLERMAEELGMTKADTLRQGLRLLNTVYGNEKF